MTNDKNDEQLAELAELMELAEQANDEAYKALIFQYTGEEVGAEVRRYTEELQAWLLAGMAGPHPDQPNFLAAIRRACRRAELKPMARMRG